MAQVKNEWIYALTPLVRGQTDDDAVCAVEATGAA
jgi:hypothetical protein